MSFRKEVSSHNQPTQKRRKLALVKCERCRIDKQKCLPVDRTWPTKCNRCIEKDFPCSEGKRVQRMTKYSAPSAPSHPPAAPIKDESDTNFSVKIQQWTILSTYFKILDLAMKVLHSLKVEACKPFRDLWQSQAAFNEAVDGSAYEEMMNFYQRVEARLSKLTAELLSSGTRSDHLPSGLLSELMSQALPLFSWQTECPICFETGDQALLRDLSRSGNVCGEYLARLGRLSRHLKGRNHWDDDSRPRLDMEFDRFFELSSDVEEAVTIALQELGLYDYLPLVTYVNLFRPDEVNAQMFLDKQGETDCLRRTDLHQWLDAKLLFSDDDMVRLRDECTSGYLNRQDILGRSLLHIATLKGWTNCARELLAMEADPALTTVYGSTPLHYAAAIGSEDLCELLFDYYDDPDVNSLDHLGNTALYYSVGTSSLSSFLKRGFRVDPNAGGRKSSPSPLIKAIVMEDENLVRLLLGHDADPHAEYRGQTATWYASQIANEHIKRWVDAAINLRKPVIANVAENNQSATQPIWEDVIIPRSLPD